MPRAIGYEDDKVQGGFGKRDTEHQYRAEEGEKHIARMVGQCHEYRVHKVTGVAFNKKGEAITIQVNCRKDWNEKGGDDGEGAWEGDCEACDKDYEVAPRYCAGLLKLGVIKGKKGEASKIDGVGAVHYWDFAATTYEKIREVAKEINRGRSKDEKKKITSTDLVITCQDTHYQKVDIMASQAPSMLTKAHVEAWKSEEGQKLVDAQIKAPTKDEMARRLKKKKQDGDDDDKGSAPAEDDDTTAEDLELSGDEEAEEEKPAKKTTKKAASSSDDEEEKPAKKGAAKAKPKKEEAEEESTGDEEIDGLLEELDE